MFKHANTFEPGDAVRIVPKSGVKLASDDAHGQITGFVNGQFEVKTRRGTKTYHDVTDLERA